MSLDAAHTHSPRASISLSARHQQQQRMAATQHNTNKNNTSVSERMRYKESACVHL
jgi:hypothetical protein